MSHGLCVLLGGFVCWCNMVRADEPPAVAEVPTVRVVRVDLFERNTIVRSDGEFFEQVVFWDFVKPDNGLPEIWDRGWCCMKTNVLMQSSDGYLIDLQTTRGFIIVSDECFWSVTYGEDPEFFRRSHCQPIW